MGLQGDLVGVFFSLFGVGRVVKATRECWVAEIHVFWFTFFFPLSFFVQQCDTHPKPSVLAPTRKRNERDWSCKPAKVSLPFPCQQRKRGESIPPGKDPWSYVSTDSLPERSPSELPLVLEVQLLRAKRPWEP